jgi:hypothetical protein
MGEVVSMNHRRSVLAALAALAFAAVLALASPALAAPCGDQSGCENPPPDPIVTHPVVSNVLTVTKTAGTVTSTPPGINCGMDCSHTSSQTLTCIDGDCTEPDPDAWDTLTLSASGGPAGYAPSWTGCDSTPGGTCSVTVGSDRAVGLSWVDVTAPSVTLTSPAAGSFHGNGSTITLSANASDNSGAVSKVEFLIGGTVVATDTAAPYSASIAASTLEEGNRTLAARATDGVALASTSSTVTVTVDKTAPVLGMTSGPAEGSSSMATTAAFAFTVAEANLDHVSCRIDDLIGEDCPSLSAAYAGLSVGQHQFKVTGYDKAGNETTLTRVWTVVAPTTGGNTGDKPDPGNPGNAGDPAPIITPGPIANPATVTIKPKRTARWTQLKTVTIKGLPSGAKVTVACKGGTRKGCPKPKTLAALKKAKLKPGAVITITIAKAGMQTKVVTITIRKGKTPKVA